MSARIAALATHIGPALNDQGVAIDPGGDEIAMAVKVAWEATAQLEPHQGFDAVIFATSGIRPVFPSGAAAIADALGLRCQAFDVIAGCTSMGIAVEIGARMNGTALVVCSDVLSRTIDPADPTHTPLRAFGDGAAAVVVRHDDGPGPRVVSHRSKTLGHWRRFYASKDGRLMRSLPPADKAELRHAYLRSWTEIGRELIDLCLPGSDPWIYANHGDVMLFPELIRCLGIHEDRLVRTSHGHAGGADPWVGLQAHPPPKGASAILLASGIGFIFHGTLLEMV